MTGIKLMKIFFYLSGREQINSRACMVSVAGGSKELLNFTDNNNNNNNSKVLIGALKIRNELTV